MRRMRSLFLAPVAAVVAVLGVAAARAAEAPVAEILSARLDGSDARSLSGADAGGPVRGPGRRVFFVRPGDDGRGAFWVMNEDGSNQRQLGAAPGDGDYGPTWSPDGRTVGITRWDASPCTPTSRNCSESVLVLVDAETGAERLVLRRGDRGAGGLSWAPDGSRLALASELDMDLGAHTLETIRPDGSGRRVLVRLAAGASPGIHGVAWSPRGDRIAYDRVGWIYHVRPQGGKSTRLVRGRNPVWSPNGKRILFDSQNDTIGIVDVATGRTRLLARAAEVGGGTWSPDGSRVAFLVRTRNVGVFSVAVVRVSDGRRLRTWQPGGNVHSLFFTRDGTRLVYSRAAS
jgi:Tol biopolymer transport system component